MVRNPGNYSFLEYIASKVRKDTVDMIYRAGSGHPGGSLSSVDILTSLYFDVMHHDPSNPKHPNRDKLVLAKGHAAPALYSILARCSYFPLEELKHLRNIDSMLQGHPSSLTTPGIEISTGSLGQGLSAAVGIALADRIDKKPSRTYALLGDGEMQEGQVWEALMSAAHYRLDNLCAVIDRNYLQIDGNTEDVMGISSLLAKMRAFGWDARAVDGHSFHSLLWAFDNAETNRGRPSAIIAKTVKGKGVSFMENQVGWHGKAPKKEEYGKAVKELDAKIQETQAKASGKSFHIKQPPWYNESSERSTLYFKPFYVKGQMVATREAYGKTLAGLGKTYDKIVALDADLSGSTKSAEFGKNFPERFFNVGIAEQNLVGIAAGMAAAGKVPFASTFAVFLTGRAYDQIRNTVAYSKSDVKLIGSHGGLLTGEDGATHIPLEDVNLMRGIPGMTVIVPSDAVQAREAVIAALNHKGPCYIRLGRGKVPVIYPNDHKFEIGKGYVLRESDNDLAAVVVNGDRVHTMLEVYEHFRKKGANLRIIDMPTVKPIDRALLEEKVDGLKQYAMITVEDHSVIGGLGDAVAGVMSEISCPEVHKIGVKDIFAESAKPDDLFRKYKLDRDGLIEQIGNIIGHNHK
jgi:transketolase